MPTWKEGDRVRVVRREVTEQDRATNMYYEHMAGLTGTVQNVYSADEVAVRVDPETLSEVSKDVHQQATKRMRARFLENISEEHRKQLLPEELNFDVHYMLLARGADLEQA